MLGVDRTCKCGRDYRVTSPSLVSRCPSCNTGWTLRWRMHRQLVLDRYKLRKGCGKCDAPVTDPRVLEFHHRDPQDKSFDISRGIKAWAWKTVKQEIAKCDLLCYWCHCAVDPNRAKFGPPAYARESSMFDDPNILSFDELPPSEYAALFETRQDSVGGWE